MAGVADDALRRADWRWLLPTPRAIRALCLAEGPVADSVAALGSALARRVDRTTGPAPHAAYDLVVAGDLAPTTLAAAGAALVPGGVLVAVIDDAPRRARGARSALRAARFEGASLVVPWPSLAAAQAWLPLAARRGGARYFLLRHPLAARHPARRVWLRARRALALGAVAARRARAVVVVARHGAGAERVVPWWVGEAARRSGAPASDARATNDWLLYAPGAGVEPRVLGVVLGADARPRAIVKLARTAGAERRMIRGARMLDFLSRAGVAAREMSPMPIGRVRDDGRVVATIESALNGIWLDAAVRRRTLVRRLEQMGDWLAALATATRGDVRDDTWARAFEPTVRRFVVACGAVADPALVHDVVARLATVGPMPTVAEHHDFRPWNVYVLPSGALAAFDWDNARADGLPGLDLVQGIAFLGFALDGTLRRRCYAESRRRQETGAFGAARRRAVAQYRDATQTSADAFRAVQAFAWMGLAADEAEARARRGHALAAADVSTSLLALWDAEARLALA